MEGPYVGITIIVYCIRVSTTVFKVLRTAIFINRFTRVLQKGKGSCGSVSEEHFQPLTNIMARTSPVFEIRRSAPAF